MGEVSNGGLPQVGQNQPPAPGGLGSRGTARAFGVEGNAAATGAFFVGVGPQSRSEQPVVGGGGTGASGSHPTRAMRRPSRLTLGSTGPTT